MTTRHPEETLVGGTANRGLVVRVGDTVRRPVRPTSASTHALLHHLQDVGFSGAPRFLGLDTHGREVLSFIEGTTVLPPYPAWSLSQEALDSVAHLLRDFHDATASFDAGAHAWGPALPAAYLDGSVVCHNDTNLDNVVFRDGRAVALIDFDLAAPGSRLWDVVDTARLWAPLRPAEDIDDSRCGHELTRLRRFLDVYGLDRHDRVRLPEVLLDTHDWTYEIVRAGVDGGNKNFGTYWRGGGSARAKRAREWYEREADRIRNAVL